MKDLFRGELVRLTAEEPETVAKSEVRWQRDSEFIRLADGDPVRLNSEKRIREWLTESRVDRGLKPERYSFWARTLEDDRLIGEFILSLDLIHSVAWVGIAIGERDFWGKGYGTDMMRLCLRYAFLELGVQRVSLGLHEYNPRALRSYEKAGFRLEGRTRGDLLREGKRYDSLWMGVLREEWLEQRGEQL
ncbi:MAG TPA: GNAT family protein [Anaerolineales bacterium]|nr:GNAT family protein [Anaerolineales bacterium]